jgi:hypothetical protein
MNNNERYIDYFAVNYYCDYNEPHNIYDERVPDIAIVAANAICLYVVCDSRV